MDLTKYCAHIIESNPDVMNSKTIAYITGFSTTTVGNWLIKGKLKSKRFNRKYIIPQTYLIEFMVSPYYRSIKNKPTKQKKDMVSFCEWYKAHMGCGRL